MLGTVVNSATIIICSFLGLFIKGVEKFEKPILNALGMGVIFLGATGVINGLTNGTNELLFLLCLAFGTIIGELLRIDDKFNKLGEFLGGKYGGGDKFSKGFISATLIYCVGAMAIIGAFEDSLGNPSILFAKSVLDGFTSIILTSVYGIGVLFSGFAVLVYQGAFTLLARFISPVITQTSLDALSTVGNVLIAAIGCDMLGIVKIKYANMLPAMFLPLFFYLPVIQNIFIAIIKVFE